MRKPVAWIVVFVIVAIGLIGWRLASARETGPGSTIALSGRIEGDESAIGPRLYCSGATGAGVLRADTAAFNWRLSHKV